MRLAPRIFLGTAILLFGSIFYWQLENIQHTTNSPHWLTALTKSGPATSNSPTSKSPNQHVTEKPLKEQTSDAAVNSSSLSSPSSSSSSKSPASIELQKTIVMARLSKQDTSWVANELPDWNSSIYVTDNTTAPLHTSKNKGHEGAGYLSYILDNYHDLPDIMLFLHSHRKGWHIEESMGGDNVNAIHSLQIPFVQKAGFVNLRCGRIPGCPEGILPFRQPETRKGQTEEFYAEAYRTMFGVEEKEVPRQVSSPCCAQFAVTRERVLARSRDEYQRYNDWLMDTKIDDETSGRVLEFSWHIMFGMDAVHCPDEEKCFCDVYGRC